jgi:hypothetical protein
LQVRIRKKRCNQIYRQFSRVAITGFRNALIVTLLSGCALFSKKHETLKDIKKICLSAEGRGRLEHSKGRHLFEFESLLNRKTNKWSLGLDLPVIGQELLYFQYPSEHESKTEVTGTFANRLKLDVTSKKKKRELKSFFFMIGELLSIIDSGSLREGWSLGEKPGRLVFQKSLGDSQLFSFEAFDASRYFERLSLKLMRKGKFGKFKPVMKMNLFLSQCSGEEESAVE